ncbi:MAG: hypothetical protein K6E51_01665 [Treponema sp.]|nr:hypothetical protein [Treponema sp.]
MKKIIVCFGILVSSIFTVFADKVTEVAYKGLWRTKESYMNKITGDLEGKNFSELNVEELKEKILVGGQFSECEITYIEKGEDSGTLEISVKEKLSVIPLPLFSWSDKDFTGGLILMDTNAFGLGNTFMTGGIFSKESVNTMVSYNKKAVSSTESGFLLYGGYAKSEYEVVSLDKEDLYSLDVHRIVTKAGVSFASSENFSFGANLAFYDIISCEKKYDSSFEIDFAPFVEYTSSKLSGWFISKDEINLEGEVGYSSTNKPVYFASTKAVKNIRLCDRVRSLFTIAGGIENNKAVMNRLTRDDISCSLISGNFYSEKMAGCDVGLEIGIAKCRLVMCSIFASFQQALIEDYDTSTEYVYGPSGGFHLYLPQVNLPAMTIEAGYNIPKHYMQFVMSLGISL